MTQGLVKKMKEYYIQRDVDNTYKLHTFHQSLVSPSLSLKTDTTTHIRNGLRSLEGTSTAKLSNCSFTGTGINSIHSADGREP